MQDRVKTDIDTGLTRLTCDLCGSKVTKLTNIGSGTCVCNSCRDETMNRRMKWRNWLASGDQDIKNLP